LLTFPQALGVVFGANLGTTGTGWLVALLGVKVSLSAAGMPMIFVGVLFKVLGRGRWTSAGSTVAGFGLLLFGLTVLQEGMAGLATRINPADLPAVASAAGSGGPAQALGVLLLVLVGVLMTTVMQSSSAAVAATLSALHAGAIGPTQAAALIIGQNIGSAASSAIAAIGATTPAKRTAMAHVLFNIVTAAIALAAFPLYAPLILKATASMDATILVAGFHTLYNVIGVLVLLPLVGPFSRLVERLVPQRGPVFTRFLDRSVLAVPAVAVEAARRTLAFTLATLCDEVANGIERSTRTAGAGASGAGGLDQRVLSEATEALGQSKMFLAGLTEFPTLEADRARLASALHALDHAARFAETAVALGDLREVASGDPEGLRAAGLCVDALRLAAALTRVETEHPTTSPVPATPDAVTDLARRSAELADLRRDHRRATLSNAATAGGGLVAADRAIVRVDAVRRLDRLVYHAWRAAAHLGGERAPTGDAARA
ncbi:MAG: Na/Pi symporter, partial [Phycisphaerales bacterium]|nr:Na/Pi symporter [Phycisphaerales bacterium]